MKRILRSMTMGAVMTGLLLPVASTEAATSPADRKKEQRFLNQLKRLRNGAAPPAKVKQTTLKLVRLNPQKSRRFYKLATLKYSTTFVQRKAKTLANQIRRIVSRELPRNAAQRVNRQVTKIENRVVNPTPTPTPPSPYQARGTVLPDMVA